MTTGSEPRVREHGACPFCGGGLWVCENHPHIAWHDGDGCCGGAGMPCRICNAGDLPAFPPGSVAVGFDDVPPQYQLAADLWSEAATEAMNHIISGNEHLTFVRHDGVTIDLEDSLTSWRIRERDHIPSYIRPFPPGNKPTILGLPAKEQPTLSLTDLGINVELDERVPDGAVWFKDGTAPPGSVQEAVDKAMDKLRNNRWEPGDEPILVHPDVYRRGQEAGFIGPNGEIDWAGLTAAMMPEFPPPNAVFYDWEENDG
jgi:hypothetical protein